MKIRSVSIAYSITKSRDEKEKTLKLENDIQILENKMNLNTTEFIQASLIQKKEELENRRQDIVKGLLLRSQANWHENGERCSEYFCKLEKKSPLSTKPFLSLSMKKVIILQNNQNIYLNRNNITGNCIHPIIYV